MAYLEELLPEFRKGAKIRKKSWEIDTYIYYKDGTVYDYKNEPLNRFTSDYIFGDKWELYQENFDWEYIIKNKCLCWFWDKDKSIHSCMGLLVGFDKKESKYFISHQNMVWTHCYPIHKDEASFYEDKKDER